MNVNTFTCITDPGLTLQIAEWSDIDRPHCGSTRIVVAWDDNRLQSLIIKQTKKPVGLLGRFN
ncbi:hypothetical protein [Thiobacillus denitrificans]|uniref:hypothetical protein n=1 Tax=Thiobacillus denitrificans TaxID=36861 RepID=UPI0003724885|nr:hypothetical protein [Thiobacillus denitrificans]